MTRPNDEGKNSIPKLSLLDTLRFNLLYFIPWLFRGLIVAMRRGTALQARLRLDASGAKMMERFRRSYGNPLLKTRVLFTRSIIILDLDVANEILAVADTAADPILQSPLNNKMFSSFMPDSVMLSDAEERQRRRHYNECVLETPPTEPTEHDPDVPVHKFQKEFLTALREETAKQLSPKKHNKHILDWQDIWRIACLATFRIVLGSEADDGVKVRFMKNFEKLIKWCAFTGGNIRWWRTRRFRSELRVFLSVPGENSLAAKISNCTGKDDPVSEAMMWLFALKDALDTHVPRALALILAHPNVHRAVREEFDGKDLSDPEDINKLALLEGCVHETLRLWTPVQLILKSVSSQTLKLKHAEFERHSHLAIHAGYLNLVEDDSLGKLEFRPDRWTGNHRLPLLHFSRGARRCAGSHLGLFAAKVMVAAILSNKNVRLASPPLLRRELPSLYNHFALKLDLR